MQHVQEAMKLARLPDHLIRKAPHLTDTSGHDLTVPQSKHHSPPALVAAR